MSLVLIADDDESVREELTGTLERAGHRVLSAATARTAVYEAQDNEPDLLLLDVNMPDMGILELLEELRSESTLSRTPIMLMAADADQELLQRTFRWDIVDFLHKPLQMDLLVAKIGAHTRLNQAYKFSRRLSKEMFMSRIERLETDMRANDEDLNDAARHITWMQPKPPKVEGYDIDVDFRPYGRLGGDFYDFVWLDRDRLAVVVGDVSGHGIQAAILQAMARKLISLGLRQEDGQLQRCVQFANRELTNDLPPGSFVAACIGVLDTRTGHWKHVRCGIPYPLLIKDRTPETLVTPGGPLGLSKKQDWHMQVGEYATILDAGQSMLLMSDGIIECYVDEAKTEQFDVDGVVNAIRETPEHGRFVAEIIERADLEQRADDDSTIICITKV